jgi:serine/threonine kinase 32
MPCLHAISSALEEDPAKRMGSASFLSFTDNPFFREIDFEALEKKELEPVFVPSSEKTNFDATYDLEELLLEEAPLEARARRQKPREQLKDDATDKEIREDELYRMIENMFLPFDYTTAAYDRYASIRSVCDVPLTLLDTPEPWTQIRPIRQPTGHNHLQSTHNISKKTT